jgi:hypothetical protein
VPAEIDDIYDENLYEDPEGLFVDPEGIPPEGPGDPYQDPETTDAD